MEIPEILQNVGVVIYAKWDKVQWKQTLQKKQTWWSMWLKYLLKRWKTAADQNRSVWKDEIETFLKLIHGTKCKQQQSNAIFSSCFMLLSTQVENWHDQQFICLSPTISMMDGTMLHIISGYLFCTLRWNLKRN